jgi:hypothetical protein
MALDINTLKPAVLKANAVATEEYVDTSISSIPTPDVSGDIADNNEIFAQKLGYVDYAAMVDAASAGSTVINAGYLNTELIESKAALIKELLTNNITMDVAGESKISSSNGNMVIDFKNGSIYIA